MSFPIFIASDFHYGAGHEEVLQPFLKLLKMAKEWNAKLFLNGDLFNFWIEKKNYIPKGCRPFVEELKKATEDGLSVFVLKGNRDFLLGETFKRETGVTLIEDDVYIIQDKKIKITHGDQYFDDVSYQRYRRFIRSKLMCWLSRRAPQWFSNYVAKCIRNSSKGSDFESYPLPTNIEDPGDYTMVLGHYHQEAIQKTAKSVMIFCPAFDEVAKVLKIEDDNYEFIQVS